MSQQLNESIARNAAISGMSNPVAAVQKKWSKELNVLNEAFNGKLSEDKKVGTAILLENTDRFLNSANRARNMFSLNEATQPSDISFFRQFAINNLLAVYPNLIASEICSVQPMNYNVA